MKKTTIKMTRYEHGEYYIDIIETAENYEAWIVGKNIGLESLMFGMPKEQQTCKEFLEIVEANLEDEIIYYEGDLEDIIAMQDANSYTA